MPDQTPVFFHPLVADFDPSVLGENGFEAFIDKTVRQPRFDNKRGNPSLPFPVNFSLAPDHFFYIDFKSQYRHGGDENETLRSFKNFPVLLDVIALRLERIAAVECRALIQYLKQQPERADALLSPHQLSLNKPDKIEKWYKEHCAVTVDTITKSINLDFCALKKDIENSPAETDPTAQQRSIHFMMFCAAMFALGDFAKRMFGTEPDDFHFIITPHQPFFKFDEWTSLFRNTIRYDYGETLNDVFIQIADFISPDIMDTEKEKFQTHLQTGLWAATLMTYHFGDNFADSLLSMFSVSEKDTARLLDIDNFRFNTFSYHRDCQAMAWLIEWARVTIKSPVRIDLVKTNIENDSDFFEGLNLDHRNKITENLSVLVETLKDKTADTIFAEYADDTQWLCNLYLKTLSSQQNSTTENPIFMPS